MKEWQKPRQSELEGTRQGLCHRSLNLCELRLELLILGFESSNSVPSQLSLSLLLSQRMLKSPNTDLITRAKELLSMCIEGAIRVLEHGISSVKCSFAIVLFWKDGKPFQQAEPF